MLHIGIHLHKTISKETHKSGVCCQHAKHDQTLYQLNRSDRMFIVNLGQSNKSNTVVKNYTIQIQIPQLIKIVDNYVTSVNINKFNTDHITLVPLDV